MTQDPIKLGGGLNGYQYVGGNPVSWVDPLGLLQGLESGNKTNQSKITFDQTTNEVDASWGVLLTTSDDI